MMIDRQGIAAVYRTIQPYVRRTPTLEVSAGDFGLDDASLTFKLEYLQHAGSFKVRGAFANLLTRKVPSAGVVAASGGNHGAAVAYAAHRLGIRATIFVPTVSSPAKIDRIGRYGAHLVVTGSSYDDAFAASVTFADSSGALPIHAFDQEETLLGQGTVGLELEQTAPLDTVLVSVGGGGLIGGVAAWYGGAANVVGIEPEAAPTLTRAREAGRPVDAPAGGIAMDSLGPARVGEKMFTIAHRYIRDVLLVTDDAIRDAQRARWDKLRIAIEPGGAAAFAAILSRRYHPGRGERLGVVLCGANTDAVEFT
jgi:threonine dehydratase